MESYLKLKSFQPCEVLYPSGDLSEIIQPGLIEILREKCCSGTIKGHIFRKIRYLLKNKVSIRDLSIQMHKAFNTPPNNSEIL